MSNTPLKARKLTIGEYALRKRYLAFNRQQLSKERTRHKLAVAAPAAADTLIKAAAGGDVRAADSILDRALGKPVQSIQAAVITDRRSLREIPTAELLALIQAATADEAGGVKVYDVPDASVSEAVPG